MNSTGSYESGPSGLSDLALSPFGMPTSLLNGEVRVAFLGRTSTEEQQDPRQSLIRQLDRSRSALPAAWVIVAHFYDVESGRLALDKRGQGTNYERFDVPIARDGGIADLLEQATRADRSFDVVVCESIARVARRTFEGLSIERALDETQVPIFASNESITLSGSRAQRVLQRRINQSVAEYEVLNTLEQSWGGLCTHVREGWNIGMPPYGYRAKAHRHPNPMKAAKGQTKSRLEPDGIKAETVTQIAASRYHEQLGYDTIADRLNADLTRYPPPEPPCKARARHAWSKSTIASILRNPKYTGYQVFNRRAMRSRHGELNDPVKWVWSPEPAHEPIIPKWMFDELNARRRARSSRPGDEPNSHPQTIRTYLFRGMLFCPCGRRMFGAARRGVLYYQCYPRKNNRGRLDKFPDHPKAFYTRESTLLDAIAGFYETRVFGPDRRSMLTAELAGMEEHDTAKQEADRTRLEHRLSNIEREQAVILRQARSGDPDDPFSQGLRQTYNDLHRQLEATRTELAELSLVEHVVPEAPTIADQELLDALPHLATNLTRAPTELLRQLFETTQLTVRFRPTDDVDVTITLPANDLSQVADTAAAITDQEDTMTTPDAQKQRSRPAEQAGIAVVDLKRTPDGIRTHATAVRGRRPRPLDDGG
jgi:site-specific DNA recombinase